FYNIHTGFDLNRCVVAETRHGAQHYREQTDWATGSIKLGVGHVSANVKTVGRNYRLHNNLIFVGATENVAENGLRYQTPYEALLLRISQIPRDNILVVFVFQVKVNIVKISRFDAIPVRSYRCCDVPSLNIGNTRREETANIQIFGGFTGKHGKPKLKNCAGACDVACARSNAIQKFRIYTWNGRRVRKRQRRVNQVYSVRRQFRLLCEQHPAHVKG